MKLKLFTSIIFISLILAVPNYAQEREIDLRELYNLCSKFPLNSRCQGRNLPILLADRTGYEGECSLLFGQATKLRPCKFTLNEQALNLYVEVGEPIAVLDNKRATAEIKISFSNVFAHTTKAWRFQSGSNQSRVSEFAEVDMGFMTEANTNSGNRSNFLKILTTPALGMSFARRLIPITAFATKTSFQNQLVTQTETLATPVDKTALVRQLLQTKACIRCDLKGANLQSANLENANLEGANLENANLAGAKLDGAYLVGANLNGANLTKADIEGARLPLSSLVKANLENAKLRGTNLQSSNLEGAILRSANLNADDQKGADLKYANLKQADLSQAQLQGADLSLANLEGANLASANLSDTTTRVGFFAERGVRYNHVTILIGANLRRANLSNANLEKASLFRANLSNASLTSTRLKNADMRDVNLSGADMNNANLEGTNLCGAIMPDGRNSGC